MSSLLHVMVNRKNCLSIHLTELLCCPSHVKEDFSKGKNMKSIIQTAAAPQAIGPYSQAVRAGEFLFISGQLGMDPSTGMLEENIETQTKRAMENIGAILAEAHGGFENIVKTTILLANINDFSKVNEIYASFLSAPFPARATYAVAALPKNALIEIEAVAYLPEK